MENPCEFVKKLSFKDEKSIQGMIFLSSRQKAALKDHVLGCSTCQHSIREIRTTGSDLINFAIDTHLGENVGRS